MPVKAKKPDHLRRLQAAGSSGRAPESNAWREAMEQLDRAAQRMNLDPVVAERMRHCKRIL